MIFSFAACYIFNTLVFSAGSWYIISYRWFLIDLGGSSINTPEKIFVNSDLKATLSCPHCGVSKQTDVSKFMKHKTQVRLKYKCTCKKAVSVILERRRSRRKSVQLKGFYDDDSGKSPLLIENISKHGVKIKLINAASLKIDQHIMLEFTLDDPNASKVKREVRIKNIFSRASIGCEFISTDHDGNLGKYFLFYY